MESGSYRFIIVMWKKKELYEAPNCKDSAIIHVFHFTSVRCIVTRIISIH